MSRQIGVWIDQTRAQVVELIPGGEPRIQTIESDVENRHRGTGGGGRSLPGHLHGSDAKRYEHRREQEQRRHFARVIELLNGADELLLLGPGQAKIAFRRELLRHDRGTPRLCAVVPADKKLTPGQLAATVRDHFAPDESTASAPVPEPPSHTPREHARHGDRAAVRHETRTAIRAQARTGRVLFDWMFKE